MPAAAFLPTAKAGGFPGFSRGEAQPKKPSLWAGGCFVVLDVL